MANGGQGERQGGGEQRNDIPGEEGRETNVGDLSVSSRPTHLNSIANNVKTANGKSQSCNKGHKMVSKNAQTRCLVCTTS